MALWLDLRNAPSKKKSLEISTRTAAAKLPGLKSSCVRNTGILNRQKFGMTNLKQTDVRNDILTWTQK